MKRILILVMSIGLMIWVAGCGKSSQPASQTPPAKTQAAQPSAPGGGYSPIQGDTVTTASGLKYIEIKVGTGLAPKTGQICAMDYTGWLTNGTKFDSSHDHGKPYPVPLGMGRVIKGWDEGISTMKMGGQRRLIVPPQLGYGERGMGGVIPPNATLIFDVELVSIQ
jgi:peptidylprolyl isomerase